MRRREFGDHIKTLSSLTSELVSVGQWLLLVLSDPPASLDTPSSLLYLSLSWTLVVRVGVGGEGCTYVCACVCVLYARGVYICTWMFAYDCICGR